MPASSGAPRDAGPITRRDFNRRAVHSAAALLAASAGPAFSADTDDGPSARVPEKPGELEAALSLVRDAAPYLPASDLPELEDQVKSVLATGKRLREHPVPDGLEPDFVFQARILPEPRP
jgi:hypothetical protein